MELWIRNYFGLKLCIRTYLDFILWYVAFLFELKSDLLWIKEWSYCSILLWMFMVLLESGYFPLSQLLKHLSIQICIFCAECYNCYNTSHHSYYDFSEHLLSNSTVAKLDNLDLIFLALPNEKWQVALQPSLLTWKPLTSVVNISQMCWHVATCNEFFYHTLKWVFILCVWEFVNITGIPVGNSNIGWITLK